MVMDADDLFPVLLWLFVVAALTVQCMASDACQLDAYATCVRYAVDPAECEGLLPMEWRK